MNTIINELKENQNIRANLSKLRSCIKAAGQKERLLAMLKGEETLLVSFLDSEDAKTRKNAALLIGDLQLTTLAPRLLAAYEAETTRFVRSAYPEACCNMELPEALPLFKEKLAELQTLALTEENRKHVEEEKRMLQKNIIKYEGITRHKFAPGSKELNLLLLTNRNLRENICRTVPVGEAKVHPLGVWVKTDRFSPVSRMRTYREILFPVAEGRMLPPEAREAAASLWDYGVYSLLTELHEGDGPFFYRLEVKSDMALEKRSDFAKKFAASMDQASHGLLVNSPSDYEVEIRLIAAKDGRLFPALRLYTYRDTRFAYRKKSISTAMNPSTAALIAELAKPYLKEGAQILDPFCGIGTLLIERNRLVPAGDMYATDIFGDAIRIGRENGEAAKAIIHFIHRDFFDFRHDYLFDEVITDMPLAGKNSREEMDALYRNFFTVLPRHLNPGAKIILYTNESGFVKKQLRLHKEYSLLQETNMIKGTPSKAGFDLFILEFRG